MNPKHYLEELQTDFTTCMVQLGGSPKPYMYKVRGTPRVGDRAIIDTGKPKEDGTPSLTIGTIVEVHDTPQLAMTADFDYKCVVMYFSITGYQALVASEASQLEEIQLLVPKLQAEGAGQLDNYFGNLPSNIVGRLRKAINTGVFAEAPVETTTLGVGVGPTSAATAANGEA